MFLNVPDIIHIVIMLKSPTVHYLELLFIVNYADWISFTILGNLCLFCIPTLCYSPFSCRTVCLIFTVIDSVC